MVKNVSVHFRATKMLKNKIKSEAQKSHLSMSEYVCRQLSNKSITVIEDGVKIYYELNKIGNNLNQIARKMNSSIATRTNVDELYKISQRIDEVWRLLNSLMSK